MPGVDFLVITALGEESRAFRQALRGLRREPASKRDVHQYYRGRLPLPGVQGAYDVCVLELLGMGRVKAATATTQAIATWRPRYVLLVGIAGGFAKKGVELGDVLIADQIVDYELQKLTRDKKRYRTEVHRTDPQLLARANALEQELLRAASVRRPRRGRSSQHVGAIASGDKVDAAGVTIAELGPHWNKLVGVEMEAGGIAQACWEQVAAQPFFMIRAVSDLADASKDMRRDGQVWRDYACRVAARYAVELLRSAPVPVERDARSLDGDWILECREFAVGTTKQVVSTDRLKLEMTADGVVTGVLTSRTLHGVRRWRVDGHVVEGFLSLAYQAQDRDRVGIGTYLFERTSAGIFKGYWTGRDYAREYFVQGPCLLYRDARQKWRYKAHLAEDCREIGIGSRGDKATR
jgi:5'-methylthioadenosine/S-adenosylhomocysteine nucleosidase